MTKNYDQYSLYKTLGTHGRKYMANIIRNAD